MGIDLDLAEMIAVTEELIASIAGSPLATAINIVIYLLTALTIAPVLFRISAQVRAKGGETS
jgi:hypothetical protein